MLVLSRKTNESIIINHDIRVVVLGIQGNKVRLGFEAPGEVAIQREELTAGTGERDTISPQEFQLNDLEEIRKA